ncbi:MAG TPA: hypothetical protein DCE14_01305 [Kosmotogaceae bacterium]|nr:hypothetical protein [Kosmotogaceae bacterium]
MQNPFVSMIEETGIMSQDTIQHKQPTEHRLVFSSYESLLGEIVIPGSTRREVLFRKKAFLS